MSENLKLCKDCKWVNDSQKEFDVYRCNHDHIQTEIDPVNGSTLKVREFCSTQRLETSSDAFKDDCGIDAQYYEPKPEPTDAEKQAEKDGVPENA